MTTRMFAVISCWCILMMISVSLALLPEILGAGMDIVQSGRNVAFLVIVIGAPLVAIVAVSTWIWEISASVLKRRGARPD